ncbi:tetratricopeptide repeat protein [Aquabacterium lacunae]|uniref:Tetratricopeptide repeat protein n=1 Tax=Aquabacterium lacunae TaxID=2528630 RepID=A0A4Q9GWT6_9BURK|nr:tetratricopeptide repeat protein [Aquabacterium lacunae]TBO29244.1 tetratricopeptide repeat protein [Aquabacterium lacunae]
MRFPHALSRSTLLCLLAAAGTLAQASESASVTSEIETRYRQGLYQRETGQPFQAIDTLESLLNAHPTLNRARLELAVAYYRTLNFDRALQEAQRVLADPATPEIVRLSVSSFVKQLELEQRMADGQRSTVSYSLTAGLSHDDNVNAGPSSDLLGSTSLGTLTLNPAFRPRSDWSQFVQGGVTHQWQRATPFRLGQQAGRLGWQTSLNGYGKLHHRENEQDVAVLSAATGPTWMVSGQWRANTSLQLDQIWLGGNDLGLYSSISPSITWNLGRETEFGLDAQFLKRDFRRSVDLGRDSDVRNVGVTLGRLLQGGRWALQGGLKAFDEQASDSRYSNAGQEGFAAVSWQAWPGGEVLARWDWRQSRFEGTEAVFGVSRREIERRWELGFSHRFTGDHAFKGWSVNTTLAHVDNTANLALYQFQRNLLLVSFGRSF